MLIALFEIDVGDVEVDCTTVVVVLDEDVEGIAPIVVIADGVPVRLLVSSCLDGGYFSRANPIPTNLEILLCSLLCYNLSRLHCHQCNSRHRHLCLNILRSLHRRQGRRTVDQCRIVDMQAS